MRYTLIFFLAFAFFSACKEKSNLEAEVIAIHDEVMPKMGDMYNARKELRTFLTDTENDSLKNNIIQLIRDLENADEGMMRWMHEWKVPESDPEKTTYLLNEKEKITKVKVDMLRSLENANNYIEKSKLK